MLHAYVAFREISLEIADARADPPQAWTAQLSLPKAAKPQAWRPKHVVMWGRLNSTIDHPHVSARTWIVGVRSMAGKGAKPSECEKRIKDILDGNVEAYVRWADMQVQGLQRDREHLKKQVRVAEQRCAVLQREC